MTKDWRYDGESAVIREMIARAKESPQQMDSRTAKTGYNALDCEVCMGQILPWSSYRLTCYIDNGEVQFVRHHLVCPQEFQS